MTACTRRCTEARGATCTCPRCGGQNHGQAVPGAALQLSLLDAPQAPAESPTAPVAAPEPPRPQPVPQRRPARRLDPWEEGECVGCKRPFTEVEFFGDIDGGRYCSDCLAKLWRASDRAEADRLAQALAISGEAS